jgi:hypothetical protein
MQTQSVRCSALLVEAGKWLERSRGHRLEGLGRGGPDIASDVWVAEQQEALAVHEAVHNILK